MEEWKDIAGYEGYYEVSSYGNVRSKDRYIYPKNANKPVFRAAKTMAQNLNSDGYPTVHLSRDGKSTRISVHILVAKAFVEGYKDGLEVDHIDFDRNNNRADNLRWVTHSENVARTYENGRGYVQKCDISGKNNPNYGNHKLSEIYRNNKEYAIEKCSRPGAQNGRAIPIIMYPHDGSDPIEFSYMAECANYLIDNGVTRCKDAYSVAGHISAAAKNNVPYYNNYFKFA